jgi:drug/metabolite transporter (DMT)-like permease
MGESVSAGIGLGVLAYALFSVHDATIKWLVATLPVWQVLFFRSATVVAACLVIGRTRLLERSIATPLKLPLLMRGVITLVAWLCYYSASRDLPLAQLLSLYFAAPLIVTVLAVPVLGETVTAGRAIAVLLGFAGVLLASDPTGVRVSLATLLVLIAAALWGYGIILMRQIARRESSMLQMLWSNGIFLAGTSVACALSWRTPDWRQFGLLMMVGVLGGIGQFSLFEAAQRAPATVMATVEYSALIWAFILGYLIWGDIPPVAVFVGAGLILLAGLILVTVERRSARKVRT